MQILGCHINTGKRQRRPFSDQPAYHMSTEGEGRARYFGPWEVHQGSQITMVVVQMETKTKSVEQFGDPLRQIWSWSFQCINCSQRWRWKNSSILDLSLDRGKYRKTHCTQLVSKNMSEKKSQSKRLWPITNGSITFTLLAHERK